MKSIMQNKLKRRKGSRVFSILGPLTIKKQIIGTKTSANKDPLVHGKHPNIGFERFMFHCSLQDFLKITHNLFRYIASI